MTRIVIVGGSDAGISAALRVRELDPASEVEVILDDAYPNFSIQDNLSANWVPAIRAFAAGNRIELVATPTYASYLNPVECHFSALTQFVVANADYLDWDAFGYALANHVRYRNSDHRDQRLAAAEQRLRVAV